MVFDILLDSSLAKLDRGGERNVSHDFTVNFYPPIELGKGNYKAALNRLITMSYSWNNIDSRYDNNKIRWKKKTEQAWKTLTFPNGMYDYKRINTFIQQHTGKVDPTNKDSDYIFTMYFDMSIYRVVTLIHKENIYSYATVCCMCTCMYSYVTRMYLYVPVCKWYATRMYSSVLVCIRVLLVCYP